MSTLHTIKAHKRDEIAALKQRQSDAAWRRAAWTAEPPRGFARQLAARSVDGYGLIAEIKQASPTKGLIRADFQVPSIAAAYRDGGAACLSTVTDRYFFQGDAEHVRQAQAASGLPVLRKDFIFDPVQVWESRAMGADCILLILAVLGQDEAAVLEQLAIDLGMDVLLECHDASEIARALRLDSRMIGINNRDLATFEADLARSETLSRLIDGDRLVISESGIAGAADITRLARAGIRCFLIGETLMRAPDIAAATRDLLAERVQ